jgi:hypothetical protein
VIEGDKKSIDKIYLNLDDKIIDMHLDTAYHVVNTKTDNRINWHDVINDRAVIAAKNVKKGSMVVTETLKESLKKEKRAFERELFYLELTPLLYNHILKGPPFKSVYWRILELEYNILNKMRSENYVGSNYSLNYLANLEKKYKNAKTPFLVRKKDAKKKRNPKDKQNPKEKAQELLFSE